MTSVSEILGRPVQIEEVVEVLMPPVREVFGYDECRGPDGCLVRGAGRAYAGLGGPTGRRASSRAGRATGPDHDQRTPARRAGAAGLDAGQGESGPTGTATQGLMRGMELNTVCEEAGCPNIYECWSRAQPP